MRKLALASIAAATLCLRLPVHAQDLVLDRFGDYLDSLRAQVGIPGLTAAIVGANDITWERPFGYSNVERLVATRTDTLYHVDGLTQTLTATLVLRPRRRRDDSAAAHAHDRRRRRSAIPLPSGSSRAARGGGVDVHR